MSTPSKSSDGTLPLGKYLASTGTRACVDLRFNIIFFLKKITFTHCQDKKTRDKAIKNLSAFLSNSSRDALPKSEMTKLWKGIFYCESLWPLLAVFFASFHSGVTMACMENLTLCMMFRFLDVGQAVGAASTC